MMRSDSTGSLQTTLPATTIPRIMVFRPTLEEMKDFSKYLEYMESQGAHHGGLAKIIPPPEWIPRKAGYENINITIKHPIKQVITGKQGIYQQYNVESRSMTFKEFKQLSQSPKYCTPDFFDYDDLERKYWKNITYNSAIYGADVPGSLTDKDCKEFNINNLNTILDMINDSYGIKIMGVNTAYLYFGMWKSTFAWHTEDMDLYSINYLHFGAPKSWYCVPPEYGKKLEKVANEFFSSLHQECPAFLRHKMTLISPQVLRKYSIPYNKITQEEGEFMITFPYSYHAGYNHGLNCAESTNFALPRWIEYGKRATVCHCVSDTVKINMDVFVKVFQPERYQNWLDGKDIGPDPKDPNIICAAPSPQDLENEYWNRISKPKRQPSYKRQLSEEANTTLALEECIDEFCNEPIVEDNDDSPDFCYMNGNGERQKNFKSRKKTKKNNQKQHNHKTNNTNNNNNQQISSNGCDNQIKDNKINEVKNSKMDDDDVIIISDDDDDTKKPNISSTSTNTINTTNTDDKSKIKLLTFGLEDFHHDDEPITTLNELSDRILQYTGNPKVFDDEIKLNYFTSLIDPFCSICILFRMFKLKQDLRRVNVNLKPPKSSQVLIPKSLFGSKLKNSNSNNNTNNNNYLDNHVLKHSSPLLICSICKLCVHSYCYGIVDLVSNPLEWKCDRCVSEDFDAACSLCPMRGGALKPTTCNQWAHLTCALVIPYVRLENDQLMKPIDITLAQQILEKRSVICRICSQKANYGRITSYIIGFCIGCSTCNEACTEFFHVTCAHHDGVLFELKENMTSFKVSCRKCQKVRPTRQVDHQNAIHLDPADEMMVIAKYNNQAYTYAKVICKHEEIFHHVHFVDNTYVDNIRSNDILNRDCKTDPPIIGDPVEVIWNKEQLHGKYAGCHMTQMYNVLFDDGLQVDLKRDELFMLSEEIPKRVQVKFTDSLKCLE